MEKEHVSLSNSGDAGKYSISIYDYLADYLRRRSRYYSTLTPEEVKEEFLKICKRSERRKKDQERFEKLEQEWDGIYNSTQNQEVGSDAQGLEHGDHINSIESAVDAIARWCGKERTEKKFDLQQSSEEKKKLISKLVKEIRETYRARLIALGKGHLERSTSEKNSLARIKSKFFTQDFMEPILDNITGDDYTPPEQLDEFVWHLFMAELCYDCIAKETSIPLSLLVYPELLYRLDFSSFKLIAEGAKYLGEMPAEIKREKHVLKVKDGKQNQADKTNRKILEACGRLGAKWLERDGKNLILLKNKEISINKLAGEIYLHTKGIVTQRRICDCLKELHEKGEI